LDDYKARDIDVLKLKHDYLKTLDALEILTQSIYKEESRATGLKLKLDTLEDNLALVYPNCMHYVRLKSTKGISGQII